MISRSANLGVANTLVTRLNSMVVTIPPISQST
jgi:hypothetical protein